MHMRRPVFSSTCMALCLSLSGCMQSSPGPGALAHADSLPTTGKSANTAQPKPLPATGPAPQTSPGAGDLPACPDGTTLLGHSTNGEVGRICDGNLPRYFAEVVIRLTQESPDGTGAWKTEDRNFKIIRGLGQRSDIMLGGGDSWIRSFEGPDPAVTVYVASGVQCEDEPASANACKYGLKGFQVHRNAAPVDVTSTILPDAPAPSRALQARYDEMGASPMWLDTEKLPLAPTMRWLIEFDPDRPLPTNDPHYAGGVAHFGFLTWNGHRFELQGRIPRSKWPCKPVPEGLKPCAYDWLKDDPFVINDK